MSLLEKLGFAEKKVEQPSVPQGAKLPTVEEIGELIVKSQVLFRTTLAEAESAATNAQNLYRSLISAKPADRPKILRTRNEQDVLARRKMGYAAIAGKNTQMLQDVKVILEIEDSFRKAGLISSSVNDGKTLQDVQKELQEAACIFERTVGSINALGGSIQAPVMVASQNSAADQEVLLLLEKLDKETDEAKRMEIESQVKSKLSSGGGQVACMA